MLRFCFFIDYRYAGYKGKMYNLKDGINAWAREVDPTMPQY